MFLPFDREDEQTLQALFEMAFGKLGFGGKTSVGYGRFEILAVRHSPDFIPPPPWQGWLRELGKVEDWGRLCDLVFHKEEAVQWRDEAGVAQAVKEAAIRVKKKYPKKWTSERDARIAEWLEPAGIPWSRLSAPGRSTPEPESSQSELEKSIRAFNDYGIYINAKLDIAVLSLAEALALQEQLKKWACHDKKAKGDKSRHWQALQRRVRELRGRGA